MHRNPQFNENWKGGGGVSGYQIQVAPNVEHFLIFGEVI